MEFIEKAYMYKSRVLTKDLTLRSLKNKKYLAKSRKDVVEYLATSLALVLLESEDIGV